MPLWKWNAISIWGSGMESGSMGCPSPVAEFPRYSRASGSFWAAFMPQDETEATSLTLLNTFDQRIFLGHLCGFGIGALFFPEWVLLVGSRAQL